jgi:hemolysin activation/secretion protein
MDGRSWLRVLALGAGWILVALLSSGLSAQTEDPVFPIAGFTVEGATLVPVEELVQAANAHAGPARRFADIEKARDAVQQAFIRRGFGAVQVVVPEQEITGGQVLLRVVEARLGRVEVSGHEFHSEANVRRSLPGLREGESPNTVALSRSLALANRSPAKQAVVSLGAGAEPGEVDARVLVRDEKPWRVILGADNTGTASTGSARVFTTLRHANLWDRDHLFAAQYHTSPDQPDDVTLFGGLYRVPLYGSGDSLLFLASYSNVSAGSVAGFPVSGRGSHFAGQYTRHLSPRGAYEHSVSLRQAFGDYRSDVSAPDGSEGLRADIRLRPLSLVYEGVWRTKRRQASGNLTLVRNLPGGSNSSQADFDANRLGAEREYTILRFGGDLTQSFANDTSLTLQVAGQWTDDLLVPVEFFGVGGVDSVRGFYTREASSDTGIQAGVEWFTPDLAPRLGLEDSGLRLSWFLDAGRVRRNDPLPGEVGSRTIAGTGLGLRYRFERSLQVRLDAARVLDDGDLRPDDDYRLHASASWTF